MQVVVHSKQFISRMEAIQKRMLSKLTKNINVGMAQVQRHIVADKLSGQVLHRRTGNLARSVRLIATRLEGETLVAGVASGFAPKGPGWYGRVHEYGAHIPERFPRRARVLHWVGKDGEDVFSRHARAFDLPARPFMRTGFAEKQQYLIDQIRLALK